MKQEHCLGLLAAAAISLAASAASAEIITQTVVGTVTVGSNPADPRFQAGAKVDFQVTWDTAQAVELFNFPYNVAPMEIHAFVGGNEFNIGGDINDYYPFIQRYYETNPILYAYEYATPGVYPERYDPNLEWGGYQESDFSFSLFGLGGPLVIYDDVGVKGLMISTDGGYQQNEPGFGGGSGVYEFSSCLRPDVNTPYVCQSDPTYSGIYLGNVGDFHAGYYGNAWVGGYAELTLAYPTFAQAQAPEPSTWALAIIGFGLAGSQLRRSRRVAC